MNLEHLISEKRSGLDYGVGILLLGKHPLVIFGQNIVDMSMNLIEGRGRQSRNRDVFMHYIIAHTYIYIYKDSQYRKDYHTPYTLSVFFSHCTFSFVSTVEPRMILDEATARKADSDKLTTNRLVKANATSESHPYSHKH